MSIIWGGELPRDWEHPEWKPEERIHNWHTHLSIEIQDLWETFTVEQKQAIARWAEEAAANEERE